MKNMTIWQLQWERLKAMARTQQAPEEFWSAFREIHVPSGGQVEQAEVEKLKALMDKFKLKH